MSTDPSRPDTPDTLRRRIAEHSSSAWALSTLRAAAECGLLERLREPSSIRHVASALSADAQVVERMADVLVAMGVLDRDDERYWISEAMAPQCAPGAVDVLRADLRALFGQSARFVEDARRGELAPGWRHTDPELIDAQGVISQATTGPVVRFALPQLPGALDRLAEPDAAVLDVGAGAAGFSIGICRAFPNVRVVGLEPGDVPYTAAVRNVLAAGLEGRIELRKQPVEALDEREAFDVSYMAQMFFPDRVLGECFARVHAALRPGGWVMTAVVHQPGSDLVPALSRLKVTLWGGGPRSFEDLERAARRAGFAEFVRMEMPGTVLPGFAARRTW
jgi:precorrin-6B methylase 2